MKKITINSKKQSNGMFGTPFLLCYMSSMSPFDKEKNLKFSAIINAIAEKFNEKFECLFMDNEGFTLHLKESKKWYGVRYNNYEINDNILTYEEKNK